MILDALLTDLRARHLLSPEQAQQLAADEQARPFSLHYELRAALYLGIVTFTGGAGVLIYENIDSLGHGVVVALLALVTAACFAYAARQARPFKWGRVLPVNLIADYVLLLGCLTLLVLLGYLQYQYHVFGERYGLATALPAALLFALAYRFDHRGVLSLAITTLAAWVGVSVAPLTIFQQGFYATAALTWGAIGLGLALLAAGFHADLTNHKRHFAYTYLSLGANVALLALLAALFEAPSRSLPPVLAAPLLLGICAALVWYARRTGSYFFLLLAAIYGYIATSYLFFKLVDFALQDELMFNILSLYYTLSAVGAVWFVLHLKALVHPKSNPS